MGPKDRYKHINPIRNTLKESEKQFQGLNVDKVIVYEVVAIKPSLVIKTVARIIQQECKSICKPGSGTLLRKKNLVDFLYFSRKTLNKELSSTCPSLLYHYKWTISHFITCLYHYKWTTSHFITRLCQLIAVAVGLHARNQEIFVALICHPHHPIIQLNTIN